MRKLRVFEYVKTFFQIFQYFAQSGILNLKLLILFTFLTLFSTNFIALTYSFKLKLFLCPAYKDKFLQRVYKEFNKIKCDKFTGKAIVIEIRMKMYHQIHNSVYLKCGHSSLKHHTPCIKNM